jgi:hypothetical protein
MLIASFIDTSGLTLQPREIAVTNGMSVIDYFCGGIHRFKEVMRGGARRVTPILLIIQRVIFVVFVIDCKIMKCLQGRVIFGIQMGTYSCTRCRNVIGHSGTSNRELRIERSYGWLAPAM